MASGGIDRVRAHIDRHFARPLAVERLAALAGMSTFHFIRAFRRATGETPHQYVRTRRIERAKHLLATTGTPITDVCDAVGFQSLGTFSRTFRQLTGEPPAKYRAARRRPAYIPGCYLRMYRADTGK